MALHLWPQKSGAQEEKQAWSWRLGHLEQGPLSRYNKDSTQLTQAWSCRGAPPLWKGTAHTVGTSSPSELE